MELIDNSLEDIEYENQLEVFLKSEYAGIKKKPGRPKTPYKAPYQSVKDESKRFNLRAFLNVAIKEDDLDETGKLSKECCVSLYEHAKCGVDCDPLSKASEVEGYKGLFNSFMVICKIVMLEKALARKQRLSGGK